MRKTTNRRKGQQSPRNPSSAWRTIPILLICLLLFVGGFFLAGRQHFSSMDYGIKNSKLRKQIEDLESEKRRLILAREISLTPNEIKRSAKKVGLADAPIGAANAQLASLSAKSLPAPAQQQPVGPLVVKTAAVATSLRPVVAAVAKLERTDKPERSRIVAETAVKQPKKTTAAAE